MNAFNRRFEMLRNVYVLLLSHLLTHRRSFIAGFLGFCLLSCGLYLMLGRDLFPTVDTGQIKLHMRAPTGTRIEKTAVIADAVETALREIIPAKESGIDHRQYRSALQRHQSLIQQLGHHRHAGCRHPDFAQTRPSAKQRIYRQDSGRAAASVFQVSSSSSSRPIS